MPAVTIHHDGAPISDANPLPTSGSGDGGGGGAITAAEGAFVDGSIVALGATDSAAVTNPATNADLIAFTRGMLTVLNSLLTEQQSHATLAETQPVSAASLPLPTGAATQATLASVLTGIQALATLAQTQPVSAASLPLPAGAATEATLTSLLTGIVLNHTNSSPLPVEQAALTPGNDQPSLGVTTAGGATPWPVVAAGSTNASVVKAAAGQVYGLYLYNNHATDERYLKFHNAAATPTAGASVFFPVPIPAQGGVVLSFPTGIPFSAGIAYTTVTGAANNNSSAVAAEDIIGFILYN
jgi:hypothetical protein